MKTLSDGVHVWASFYPFPQIILGGYLTVTRGITVYCSPAASLLDPQDSLPGEILTEARCRLSSRPRRGSSLHE
jgi:hypothetical protein